VQPVNDDFAQASSFLAITMTRPRYWALEYHAALQELELITRRYTSAAKQNRCSRLYCH
jgi:hypothetical protein